MKRSQRPEISVQVRRGKILVLFRVKFLQCEYFKKDLEILWTYALTNPVSTSDWLIEPSCKLVVYRGIEWEPSEKRLKFHKMSGCPWIGLSQAVPLQRMIGNLEIQKKFTFFSKLRFNRLKNKNSTIRVEGTVYIDHSSATTEREHINHRRRHLIRCWWMVDMILWLKHLKEIKRWMRQMCSKCILKMLNSSLCIKYSRFLF